MYHSRFTGSRYEAAYRYGNILHEKGKKFVDAVLLTPEKKEFAKKCHGEYEKAFPEILEEIRSLADGWRVSLQDMESFLFSMYCMTFGNKCSCFACRGENNLLLGRNSDFLVELEDYYESTYYRLDGCYSFIGNTTAMVQMEDGVNECRLAVGLTFIYPVVFKPGINAGMIVRYLLEKCATVEEALNELHRLPIASAQTITMADKTGDVALVECNCEKVTVIRPAGNENFVAATNQFVSKEMKPYQYGGVDDIKSGVRYETVTGALRNNHDCSPEFAENLLSGKYGFLCQYDRSKGMDTVWSTVYDLKNGKIYRVEGNPSREKFREDRRLKFVEP